jgi:hypothetical protein
MKLIKTASGKRTIKLSKKEWQAIGKTAGWFGDMFGGNKEPSEEEKKSEERRQWLKQKLLNNTSIWDGLSPEEKSDPELIASIKSAWLKIMDGSLESKKANQVETLIPPEIKDDPEIQQAMAIWKRWNQNRRIK